MVHGKPRWKWHECLQKVSVRVTSNDSDCENDDYHQIKLHTIHQQDFDAGKDHNDILKEYQRKLKKKAKIEFLYGAKMARLQVELERLSLKKSNQSSLYDLIGIPKNNETSFTVEMLQNLNIGQLKLISYDLICQIEQSNQELVDLLIERDSLSMKQDSILVDIEDLTKRLEERASGLSMPTAVNEIKPRIPHSKNDPSKLSIFRWFLQKTIFS